MTTASLLCLFTEVRHQKECESIHEQISLLISFSRGGIILDLYLFVVHALEMIINVYNAMTRI